jgi:hypothetical protein
MQMTARDRRDGGYKPKVVDSPGVEGGGTSKSIFKPRHPGSLHPLDSLNVTSGEKITLGGRRRRPLIVLVVAT